MVVAMSFERGVNRVFAGRRMWGDNWGSTRFPRASMPPQASGVRREPGDHRPQPWQRDREAGCCEPRRQRDRAACD